jgi:hypothetical protein
MRRSSSRCNALSRARIVSPSSVSSTRTARASSGCAARTTSPCRWAPVDQLDHGVVSQLEPIGQLADGGPPAFGKSLERQQEHVLLRSQAGLRTVSSLKRT